ncbi:SpvB/TcaC N-terminal domain-containing protein [Agromyces neolithicus]|uniref:Insecticide toxin TcdB middle/N-terminal domain-containing protein n=1 Tax=Agromyces neolithicus TaxID=269420 RepID=A0ABN2LRZ8_9MICO
MSRHRTQRRLVIAIVATVALVAGTAAVAAELLGGGAAGDDGQILPREEQVTPADLGDGNVDWLQYADAAEGLSLVGAPTPSSDGGAHLSYPLVIPGGRGLMPELSLEYDSDGGEGWTGLGWDLSVGEISVDTAFGAPHFDAARESESYLLDGAMLVPNALGDAWEPRVRGDREDYTHQVEGDYERIIRHEAGNGGPDDYFWEVRDKNGGVRWYGGTLDGGGPDGTIDDPNSDNDDDRISVPPVIDRDAIVTDENGNQVRWLLSAERDVGVNTMTYDYRTRTYKWEGKWVRNDSCVDSDTVLCARHTYLDSISYTGAAQASGEPADPAYQVKFILETDPDPVTADADPTLRADTILDATGRYLDLVAERLAYIEVRYGDVVVNPDFDPVEDGAYANRPFDPARPELGPSRFARTHDQVAARYRLDYVAGPFGKSLLSAVVQGVDPAASATHTFDYHDLVTDGAGEYSGFDTAEQAWDTGDAIDIEPRAMLDVDAQGSALGMSTSNSAEGHAYIGFNPTAFPQKTGSFGGSFQVGGGRTDAISEWIDLDGDGLPDKVFAVKGGGVKFRLNQSGPDGGTMFSPASTNTISGLDRLSGESELSFQISGEAYPIVTVALGVGASVAWGDAYFLDVNADGLPDFITGSKVLFNKLVNGVPTFSEGSAGTYVPIIDGETPTGVDPEIEAIRGRLAAQSPLIDTVRRWIAPFDGTVEIDAPVTLVGTSVDGVRVSLEHGTADGVTDLDDPATLGIGQSAFTTKVEQKVSAGDRLYFRLNSIDDGVGDEVTWAPVIRYLAVDGFDQLSAVPLDVNGLSQVEFDSAHDFTLSGRPGTAVGMPLGGEVQFTGTIEKTATTTDDLQLELQRARTVKKDEVDTLDVSGFEVTRTPDGGTATTTTENDVVIPADFIGSIVVEAAFDVATPELPSDPNPQAGPDRVSAWLDVDSPIDLHAFDWQPRLDYVSAFDREGDPVDVTNLNIDLPPEVDHYPMDDGGVSESWSPDATGKVDANVELVSTGTPLPTSPPGHT